MFYVKVFIIIIIIFFIIRVVFIGGILSQYLKINSNLLCDSSGTDTYR